MITQIFRVSIRRNVGLQVKPETEQIDGRTYTFRYGWKLEDDDSRYPGEHAWIPHDKSYPANCPDWIASGDLKHVADAPVDAVVAANGGKA